MQKISSIMAATDFGPESALAVHYAFSVAEQAGARLFLCAALEKEKHESHAYIDMAPAPTHEKLAEMRHATIEKLRALAPRAYKGKVEFEPIAVVADEPLGGIMEALEELEIDLLIITAGHGLGSIMNLLHGGLAQKLIDHAPCPCLVLGPETLRKLKSASSKEE